MKLENFWGLFSLIFLGLAIVSLFRTGDEVVNYIQLYGCLAISTIYSVGSVLLSNQE